MELSVRVKRHDLLFLKKLLQKNVILPDNKFKNLKISGFLKTTNDFDEIVSKIDLHKKL
jgi:hypothetical protein